MRRMTVLDEKLEEVRATLRAKEAALEEARRLLAELQQQVAIATASAEAWEQAAALLRLPSDRSKLPPHVRRTPRGDGAKGRQLGAISKVWRAILNEMTIYHPEGATDDQIAEIGRAGELPNLRPRDARRQMQKYQRLGFVEYAHPLLRTGWQITPEAANRFGIDLPESKAAADSQSAAAPDLSSSERV